MPKNAHSAGEIVSDAEAINLKGIVAFGPFRLCAKERLLEKDGASIDLGGRALDILASLVERAGEVVTKDELISRAWPNLTVEEGNLRFQIAALRKILGDGKSGVHYIKNIAGRGYCFIAPITQVEAAPDASSKEAVHAELFLPHSSRRMIGREQALRLIARHLATHR